MSNHEIFFESSESTGLAFSGGDLKTKETVAISGYGIRAVADKRLGFAYCQNEEELDQTIEKAKKMSKFSVKSGFSFATKSKFKTPQIYDDSVDVYDYPVLKELLDEAREAAEAFGGKSRIMVSAYKEFIKLQNTEGFEGNYKKTLFSLFAESMHGDGLGISYFISNKKPKEVRETGLKAAGMAKDMQGAKKPAAGLYTVVVQIEALESLMEVLMPSFSGDWKRRGISRLATKRFSDKLTICEDGLSHGTDARPFDDEGTPSEKRYLVRDGQVKSFLYDRETAALEGVQESGACSRSCYDDSPSIGSSNIVVSTGEWKDLGELDRYIELHYVHGAHTANLTTGDLGLEVSAAFLHEGDKRTPLKGFMVTGNIFDMFANIEAVESKQRTLGWLVAPRIAFKNLRIVS